MSAKNASAYRYDVWARSAPLVHFCAESELPLPLPAHVCSSLPFTSLPYHGILSPLLPDELVTLDIEAPNGKGAAPKTDQPAKGQFGRRGTPLAAREMSMNMLQVVLALQSLLANPQLGVGTGVLGPLQPLLVTFMSSTPLN